MLVIFDTTPGANERKPGVIAASARWKDFPANANHFMDSGMRRIVRNSVEAGSVNFISGPVAFGLLDDNFVHGLSPGDALPNVSMVLNLDNGSKVGGCHRFTRSPSSRQREKFSASRENVPDPAPHSSQRVYDLALIHAQEGHILIVEGRTLAGDNHVGQQRIL
jgi:hypothetical protein